MTTRMNSILAGALLLTAGFFHSSAAAQAPALIPIQGVLTDDAGTAVDGDTSVQFSLYGADLGGSPLYTETQTVAVAAGLFSVYLGDIVALDMSIFRDNSVWLGVSIDGGVELSPRVQFATAPYAAYAAFAGDAATVGGVGASGLVRSTVGAGISINASNEISIDRTQFDSWVTENVGAEADTNPNNHARFTDAEAVTAVSAADSYVRNAGDTVTGPLRVSSTLTVTGAIDARGGITIACPTGKTHVGAWCMSTFRKVTSSLAAAVSTCAAESAQVCPLAALVACQSVGTPAACVSDTTPPGAISTSPGVLTGDFAPWDTGTTNVPAWRGTYIRDVNAPPAGSPPYPPVPAVQDAMSLTRRSIVYHSGVDISGTGAGPEALDVARVEDASAASLRYYCCTPAP